MISTIRNIKKTTKKIEIYFSLFFYIDLKSATKPFYVLLACTRPLVTELSDKLRSKHPLLPTTSYLTLKLETIHLHDKNRHSEVFAIDILDNLGGIHLRDAPTIDNVYRRCMKEKLPCKS